MMGDALPIDERNIERDALILEHATRIVKARGLSALTRELLADVTGLAPASISNFGRTRITNGEHERIGYRDRILAAMMAEAVEKDDRRLIIAGLADGCLEPDRLAPQVRAAMGV